MLNRGALRGHVLGVPVEGKASSFMSEEKTRMRVLFVDDEALILTGIRRMLHSMRQEWEMVFLQGGAEALKIMATEPCQVVVSDIRMPGMNGVELLARLQKDYPQTVRLILSGHADRDLIMQCVGTAHQFLAKPCDRETLCAAIKRACAFNASVKSERIKAIIAQMECLPSIPALLHEIIQHLQKDDCSLDEVGMVIAKDIAITAKLLKLVNSAFFGLGRPIVDPVDAVSYLGLETVKALVLTVSAFATYEAQNTGPLSFESLWNHSLRVAASARKIANAAGASKQVAEESFIAGMLHDIGKLALAANLPEPYEKVFQAAEELGLSLHAAEEAAFGAHHGDVGGYLLSLWGLPPGVVDAITLHHEPQRADSREFTPVAAVHIANGLSHESDCPNGEAEYLNIRFLDELGVSEYVSNWRSLAKNAD